MASVQGRPAGVAVADLEVVRSFLSSVSSVHFLSRNVAELNMSARVYRGPAVISQKCIRPIRARALLSRGRED